MDRLIKGGTADTSVDVYIIDSTDGTPETGVLWNTAGIDLKYRREGAVVVAITEKALGTPALDDAHDDGGFLEIGNGVYRLDLPDAACAAGAKNVVVFGTVTGMIVLPVEIQLVSFDPDDAVRAGLTALPNAAADAAGGLPISDAGGLDLDALDSQIDDIETDTAVIGALGAGLTNLPWNASWDAEVQSECADALTAYDPPTKAEMDAVHATTDALVTTVDGVVDTILVDTAEIGAAGAGLTAVPWNASWDAEVESEVTDSLVAHNLDHLCLTATGAADMTTEVVDNTILSRMLANGDTSAFVPSTDGLQLIRDAITAAADIIYVPDASSTVTDGTVQSGTFASTASDNGTRWVVQLETDNDTNVDVTCEFNMGAGRVATEVGINGYYDAGGVRACQVYAWNYTTAGWDKLSAAGADTEMRNRSTDKDYLFSLNAAHTDRTTVPGEVKIRFYTDGGGADEDDLHLDYVYVDGAAEGGTSPAAIAQAVHSELDSHLTHIPCFTGSIRYVHGTSGDDANSGEYPDIAFASIGAAVSASSPGDMIRVFATTYSEAVVLAADGLELWCEIGTIIDGNTGVPLTVSGDSCRVIGPHLTPDAGQIGCIVSGTDEYLELCENHATGLAGFQFAATAARCEVIKCVANNFTGTGFDVKGFSNVFDQCVARGDGGTEKGFHLSDTAAHRNVFTRCKTVDCATAGWTVDAGADDNLFDICSDSAGCGTKVDNGSNNSWRGFLADDASASELAAIKTITDALPDAGALNDLAAILTDTAVIGAAGAGLTDLGGMSAGMKAEVNSEVSDVLKTDTVTLPGQVAPPLAPTLEQAIAWLYKVLRNRKTQTATDWKLMADDESTVDAKATVSSDGTTAIKQEIVSGP